MKLTPKLLADLGFHPVPHVCDHFAFVTDANLEIIQRGDKRGFYLIKDNDEPHFVETAPQLLEYIRNYGRLKGAKEVRNALYEVLRISPSAQIT